MTKRPGDKSNDCGRIISDLDKTERKRRKKHAKFLSPSTWGQSPPPYALSSKNHFNAIFVRVYLLNFGEFLSSAHNIPIIFGNP